MRSTTRAPAAEVPRPHWTAGYVAFPADLYLDLRREMPESLAIPERDFLIRTHARTLYVHLTLRTLIRVLRKRARAAGLRLPGPLIEVAAQDNDAR